MDHPDFIVCGFMENSRVWKELKKLCIVISDMNHMLRIDTKNLWKTKEKLMR